MIPRQTMFVAQLNVATCSWRAATTSHFSGISPGIGTYVSTPSAGSRYQSPGSPNAVRTLS